MNDMLMQTELRFYKEDGSESFAFTPLGKLSTQSGPFTDEDKQIINKFKKTIDKMKNENYNLYLFTYTNYKNMIGTTTMITRDENINYTKINIEKYHSHIYPSMINVNFTSSYQINGGEYGKSHNFNQYLTTYFYDVAEDKNIKLLSKIIYSEPFTHNQITFNNNKLIFDYKEFNTLYEMITLFAEKIDNYDIYKLTKYKIDVETNINGYNINYNNLSDITEDIYVDNDNINHFVKQNNIYILGLCKMITPIISNNINDEIYTTLISRYDYNKINTPIIVSLEYIKDNNNDDGTLTFIHHDYNGIDIEKPYTEQIKYYSTYNDKYYYKSNYYISGKKYTFNYYNNNLSNRIEYYVLSKRLTQDYQGFLFEFNQCIYFDYIAEKDLIIIHFVDYEQNTNRLQKFVIYLNNASTSTDFKISLNLNTNSDLLNKVFSGTFLYNKYYYNDSIYNDNGQPSTPEQNNNILYNFEIYNMDLIYYDESNGNNTIRITLNDVDGPYSFNFISSDLIDYEEGILQKIDKNKIIINYKLSDTNENKISDISDGIQYNNKYIEFLNNCHNKVNYLFISMEQKTFTDTKDETLIELASKTHNKFIILHDLKGLDNIGIYPELTINNKNMSDMYGFNILNIKQISGENIYISFDYENVFSSNNIFNNMNTNFSDYDYLTYINPVFNIDLLKYNFDATIFKNSINSINILEYLTANNGYLFDLYKNKYNIDINQKQYITYDDKYYIINNCYYTESLKVNKTYTKALYISKDTTDKTLKYRSAESFSIKTTDKLYVETNASEVYTNVIIKSPPDSIKKYFSVPIKDFNKCFIFDFETRKLHTVDEKIKEGFIYKDLLPFIIKKSYNSDKPLTHFYNNNSYYKKDNNYLQRYEIFTNNVILGLQEPSDTAYRTDITNSYISTYIYNKLRFIHDDLSCCLYYDISGDKINYRIINNVQKTITYIVAASEDVICRYEQYNIINKSYNEIVYNIGFYSYYDDNNITNNITSFISIKIKYFVTENKYEIIKIKSDNTLSYEQNEYTTTPTTTPTTIEDNMIINNNQKYIIKLDFETENETKIIISSIGFNTFDDIFNSKATLNTNEENQTDIYDIIYLKSIPFINNNNNIPDNEKYEIIYTKTDNITYNATLNEGSNTISATYSATTNKYTEKHGNNIEFSNLGNNNVKACKQYNYSLFENNRLNVVVEFERIITYTDNIVNYIPYTIKKDSDEDPYEPLKFNDNKYFLKSIKNKNNEIRLYGPYLFSTDNSYYFIDFDNRTFYKIDVNKKFLLPDNSFIIMTCVSLNIEDNIINVLNSIKTQTNKETILLSKIETKDSQENITYKAAVIEDIYMKYNNIENHSNILNNTGIYIEPYSSELQYWKRPTIKFNMIYSYDYVMTFYHEDSIPPHDNILIDTNTGDQNNNTIKAIISPLENNLSNIYPEKDFKIVNDKYTFIINKQDLLLTIKFD